MEGDAADRMPQVAVRITDIFRANLIIPLGLVTVLTALGWLLVIQPRWESPPAAKAGIGQSAPQAAGALTSVRPVRLATLAAAETTEGEAQREAPPPGAAAFHLSPRWTPVNFAFLGAYFFGIQMIFRRFVRRDLGPNAYMALSNRIILAVSGVWVAMVCYDFFIASRTAEGGWDFARPFVAGVAQRDEWPTPLLVVAFVIGVFPRMLWQIIAAFFTKVTFLKLVLPSIEAKQPLSDLDGLTVWHESRLEEEDVENVPNMASVDVVDIMLHTQIPAERLIAWIDQAILGSALGPAQGEAQSPLRGKLRTLGIRTATQLLAV